MDTTVKRQRIRRLIAGVALAGLLGAAIVVPALAADTVAITLIGGTLTSSVADLTLTAVNYSHSNQNQTGTMALTVDDSRGQGSGWNVTVQSSAFVYSGAYSGSSIPAANFSITTASTPVMTAGQAVDGTGGPKVPAISPAGTLDSARKVIQANANYGQGTYTQNLAVQLTIPGQSRAGAYTGTMTVTENNAP